MNALEIMRKTSGGLAPRASMGSNPCRGAEEEMAALTLNSLGLVHDCSRATETLFKYRRNELVWRHVSLLLPQLADMELMQHGQINPRLRYLCRIGHPFQAVTQDGTRFSSDLFFNRINSTAHEGMTLIVRPAREAASDRGQRTSGDWHAQA